ncbi:MAG: LysM peptidoglycan-binding domain-containing protein [Archangium sp.]
MRPNIRTMTSINPTTRNTFQRLAAELQSAAAITKTIPAAVVRRVESTFTAAVRAAAPVVTRAATRTAASSITYRVRPGDTVASIARKLHITKSELGALNDLSKPLKSGQVLRLGVRNDNPASRKPPQVPKKWSHFLHADNYRFENSVQGLKHAAKHEKAIDLDVNITKDGVPVNTHWGDVFKRGGFYDPLHKLPKNARISDLTAKEVFRLRSKDGYRIHSMKYMLRKAAKLGVRVEYEAKGSKPFEYGKGGLKTFVETKKIADAAHTRMFVKTISTTKGAMERLKAAHRAGLTTVLLPRGPVPKSWRPYIDYVRGPVKWING